MSLATLREPAVSRPKAKKGDETPKRYGTMVRLSDHFAEMLKKAAMHEDKSMADFADEHLLAIVEKRYKDSLARETKRLEGGSK